MNPHTLCSTTAALDDALAGEPVTFHTREHRTIVEMVLGW